MTGTRPEPILLAGATLHADVVVDSFEWTGGPEFLGILNNQPDAPPNRMPRLLPVIQDPCDPALLRDAQVVCLLGTTRRRQWIEELAARDARFGTLVHPSCVISSRSTIGEGCILDAGTILAGFTDIGAHVRIGRGSRIGHHSVIGPYSTIHPGCIISGNVRIGAQVTIGTGSVLIDGITVQEGAVIAAGSVVTKKVPAGSLFRGNPARLVRENYGPV